MSETVSLAEARRARSGGPADDEPPSNRPPEFSDDALALRFTEAHGGELRYVAAWGKWLEWDNTRWRFDSTLHAFDRSRLICRAAAADAPNVKIGEDVASARTVAAIEKLARADRRHAATIDAFDRDPWLLNTPGGTVDLRSGKLRPHDRADLITKSTVAAPGGNCPQWRAFLDRVTAGDVDLARFLRRIAGYALTGTTREHALFFAHGTGANGKGVFINTLTKLLGDYAVVAPADTFTSASDRHPTDLAMLRGARLVTAQETEEGRAWAEAKIKSLTGGDPISARFMRQDFFTFQPQFKLLIAGNHKPSLRNVDEAIRRRFHLLPFTVTVPEEERDQGLPDKLAAEWPGILAWAIEGCLEWQRIGLYPPQSVTEATDKYLAEEDSFETWISERAARDPRAWETVGELFGSWTTWAEKAGEKAWTKKRFAQTLEARGFEAGKVRGERGYFGLRLNRPDYSENWEPAP